MLNVIALFLWLLSSKCPGTAKKKTPGLRLELFLGRFSWAVVHGEELLRAGYRGWGCCFAVGVSVTASDYSVPRCWAGWREACRNVVVLFFRVGYS